MTSSSDDVPVRIFLSYRREDTAYPAAWLYDRLASYFGRSQVFKYVDSIELGDDFLEVITAAVGSCDVLLALIGDRWVTVTGQDGQLRLDDPGDVVRLEIEVALARDVRVIPILVHGARMPRADELPVSLAPLTRRNALELSAVRFDADARRLLMARDRVIAEVKGQACQDAERAAARRRHLAGPARDRAAARDRAGALRVGDAACGGDAREWEARWRELDSQLEAERGRITSVPPTAVQAGAHHGRPRSTLARTVLARTVIEPQAVSGTHPAGARRLRSRLGIKVKGRVHSGRMCVGTQEDVLEQLAAAVEAQWASEAEVRGLNHPLPLAVRWSAADREVMDRIPAATGEHEGAGDWLARLSGRLDGVADAFERLPSRRLVVLGEPGAGKTVLAVQLVRDLLKRRQPGQPVPVLLPIASWDPHAEHLLTWMAARLEEMYPALRAVTAASDSTMALQFARTSRILPVLDGLDEMAADCRAPAVRSLNRMLGPADSLVVTCRVQEYRHTVVPPARFRREASAAAVEPLVAAAVVLLCPLLPADVQVYLRDATPEHDTAKWAPVFARLRQDPGGPLAQALSTPLMTALARTAYSDTTADPVALLGNQLGDRHRIEDHLLDQLIPAVYADQPRPDRRNGRWNAQQAESWLRFLARHLNQLSTRDLAWWQIQLGVPSRAFSFMLTVTSGLTLSITLGLASTLAHGLLAGVKDATFGLMFGLAAALAAKGPECSPSNVSTPRRRPQRLVHHLVSGLAGGLLGGLAYAFADVPADGQIGGLTFGLANGATVGLAVGFSAGLADYSSPSKVQMRLRANLRRVTRPLIAGLTFGLAMGFIGGIVVRPVSGFLSGLAIGLMTGLVTWLRDALGAPADITQASSPSSVWSADRTAAITHGLVFSLMGGVTVGGVAAAITGPSVGPGLGLDYGLAYAFAGAGFTAWYRFLVARLCLRVQGRLPWPLMAFLAEAHHRGVLRQVGAVYQFRHARLQDRLAACPPREAG
jgi:hypothetical protein